MTNEMSNAQQTAVTDEARQFATVWLLAYEETRRVLMEKGLPQQQVVRCAELIADEIFNRHLLRLGESEVG